MSDLTSTSCCDRDDRNRGSNGISPIILILILLCSCGGGSNGFLGGSSGNNECGNDNGFGSILPIILILCLCGGSF